MIFYENPDKVCFKYANVHTYRYRENMLSPRNNKTKHLLELTIQTPYTTCPPTVCF